ncbi:hypothetical protein PMY38_13685 [Clostridium tertium]|jgi:hypothetical protein|uniref:hypothetical protein n=1 Tax=Clostridium tertium TaxID=1559 RepID=UPI000DCFC2B5|nr:hypothetical protein [Clostridium tertium]MDB1939185.1 hypothetical protein [Clostridium tertium]MDB1947648.1 hypothetical protein [Clostridium tertium]MDB1956354.1 hypothetical protein [Clostridium tertium]MDB1959650.1 hypothetical protein [Clostridium tertium]MDB1961554.1 hypothetical protein [Clostridium tertium]
MDTNLKKLIDVLIELRSSSMHANKNTVMDLMKNYNLLFLGSKFNTIYSNELPQSVKTYFNFDISIDKLNQLIPTACKALQMKFKPMIAVSDVGNPNAKINCYTITLW